MSFILLQTLSGALQHVDEVLLLQRLQDRDAMLEKLRQTCNGQRDYITRQAEQIRELSRSLQDVTVSSQRQVFHCASPLCLCSRHCAQILFLSPSISSRFLPMATKAVF